MAHKNELDERAQHLTYKKLQGVEEVHVAEKNQVIPIDERIREYEVFQRKLDLNVSSLDSKAEIKYQVFKWTFAFGIICLASSRLINPILELLKECCKTV